MLIQSGPTVPLNYLLYSIGLMLSYICIWYKYKSNGSASTTFFCSCSGTMFFFVCVFPFRDTGKFSGNSIFGPSLFIWSTPSTNRANVFFFCRLYPSAPQPTQHCLASTCHLSTLSYHFIAGTGLPNRMNGEVSWEPRPLSLQSSLPSTHRPLHPLPNKTNVRVTVATCTLYLCTSPFLSG